MQDRIKATDFIYYVATPDFIGKWNEAKERELICHMHGEGHRGLASARQHGDYGRKDGCGGHRAG